MSNVTFYRCEVCGNMVAQINNGGGTLTCCGKPMIKLEANSTDAAQEKHVSVITKENGKIRVSVGSVAHPMTAEHFIEWIAFVAGNKVEMVKLEPGMDPKAEFSYYPGDEKVIFVGDNDEIVPNCEGNPCNFVYSGKESNKASVYAYCNLHGLWKSDL
jgi:superoxide reductase